LISTALDAGAVVESLYLAPQERDDLEALADRILALGGRVFSLEEGVLERVASAMSPQPAMAIVGSPIKSALPELKHGVVVLVEDLRDPGNAGTIVRSADAFGAQAVVFTGSSVDPTNPKVVRSTAGSLFHLPIVKCSVEDAFEALENSGFTSAATVMRGNAQLGVDPLADRLALWVGNEAHGLSAAVVDRCALRLSIPMQGSSESLNAGVAASIALYEAQRQGISSAAGRSTMDVGKDA